MFNFRIKMYFRVLMFFLWLKCWMFFVFFFHPSRIYSTMTGLASHIMTVQHLHRFVHFLPQKNKYLKIFVGNFFFYCNAMGLFYFLRNMFVSVCFFVSLHNFSTLARLLWEKMPEGSSDDGCHRFFNLLKETKQERRAHPVCFPSACVLFK